MCQTSDVTVYTPMIPRGGGRKVVSAKPAWTPGLRSETPWGTEVEKERGRGWGEHMNQSFTRNRCSKAVSLNYEYTNIRRNTNTEEGYETNGKIKASHIIIVTEYSHGKGKVSELKPKLASFHSCSF